MVALEQFDMSKAKQDELLAMLGQCATTLSSASRRKGGAAPRHVSTSARFELKIDVHGKRPWT
jgi:hypothetical protein